MNSNFSRIYWFDFNGTVNENLPLTYNTLKICREEIKKLELNNDKKIGSKTNPIKLNLSFEQKYSNDTDFNLDLNIYENSNSYSFLNNLNNNIKSYTNLFLQPLNYLLEFKLNLSS